MTTAGDQVSKKDRRGACESTGAGDAHIGDGVRCGGVGSQKVSDRGGGRATVVVEEKETGG